MSGAQTPPPATPSGTGGADPSMEDILASIRRILSEDEPAGATGAAPDAQPAAAVPADDDDVLALDSSMMVADDDDDFSPPPLAKLPPVPEAVPPVPAPPGAAIPVAAPAPSRETDDLIAPATAAAVATSVGGLLRTLIAEREQVVVHRGGPTIEDMVREEIRPLLKEWLEVNLQPMVERLVRAEIERVVGRGVS